MAKGPTRKKPHPKRKDGSRRDLYFVNPLRKFIRGRAKHELTTMESIRGNR